MGQDCCVSRKSFKDIPPFNLRDKVKQNGWNKETLREIILQAHALMNNYYCGTFLSEMRLL